VGWKLPMETLCVGVFILNNYYLEANHWYILCNTIISGGTKVADGGTVRWGICFICLKVYHWYYVA